MNLQKEPIEKAKLKLLAEVGNTATTKKNTEKLILAAFNDTSFKSSLLLSTLEKSINSATFDFSDIIYTEVINDKIEEFLKTTDIQTLLNDYLNKYNEIISRSKYFRKHGFNPYNAAEISKNLNGNRYFAANHSLVLNDNSNHSIVIKSPSELDNVILEEKNQVLNDPELKQKFAAIEVALNRNIELRHFYEYITKNDKIIPELVNINLLKKKLWLSYLKLHIGLYNEFLVAFKQGKREIEQITDAAEKQQTRWQEVVEIFKNRFYVPFDIKISNQVEAILNSKTPKFDFNFSDGVDSCVMDEEEVSTVLSTGEQRALYLLNIIYEISVLESEINQSILILDDIADSFDYKNKYAIIEYLKDVAESNKYFMLVMTHNFDFYRTIQSRLYIKR